MNEVEIFISLAGTILGLLITIITFIVKLVRSSKSKKGLEQTIRISNAVLSFIRDAENFTHYSGIEKKEYVMTKANQFAIENKIVFNQNQVSEKVEELVALTKQVNCKKNSSEKAVELKNSWL